MTLLHTGIQFNGQTGFYSGKVRDVYYFDHLIAMVVSDRISAFDHILPRPIPYKGQVLNQIALHFLEASKDLVPNWLIASPDPNVSIGYPCEPVKIEMVVRGYLAGHAWRTYASGQRVLCGVEMPEGMQQNDAFPQPIITPTTKASEGHDEDISAREILNRGIIDEAIWNQMCQYALMLFDLGQKMANERGLILVDTKYEFGIYNGQLILIDEIHTPDSSRYFYLDGYQHRQDKKEPQKQLSKEFVREWLMVNGFQGREGEIMPEMPDDFVKEISDRYIELFELITGKNFIKESQENLKERIENNVNTFLANYVPV
ncbi:MAG TPA: phosphoribosylaminoimidazolesuccinocarboxamide synthase [Saprospiraceae bacterium]|nr:phosphoribosylaminoimidazolesuccinocarboxamide synthase [Saprospiraceae bacterium]